MNALVPVQTTYPVSDLERMARALAGSKLFGVQNAEQALALCLVAQAEGRHPATAAQDYSIIQNRPSKKADAMLRDFLAAGGKVEWHKLDDTIADASFSHPAGGKVRIDWTLDRATKAGLAGNAMYKKYPRQMLRSRTISEGVRTVCPGATSGMYVPEEVEDIVAEVRPSEARAPAQQAALPPPAETAEDFHSTAVIAAATMAIEMCRTVEQCDEWKASNEAMLDQLSTDEFNALARAWKAHRASLKGKAKAATSAKPADDFGLGDDQIPNF